MRLAAHALAVQGKWAECVAVYDECASSREALPEERGSDAVASEHAWALKMAGNLDAAVEVCRVATDAHPRSAPLLLTYESVLSRAGRKDDASACLMRVLQEQRVPCGGGGGGEDGPLSRGDTWAAVAANGLCLSAAMCGAHEDAVAHSLHAVRLSRGATQHLYNHVLILARCGRLDEARDAWTSHRGAATDARESAARRECETAGDITTCAPSVSDNVNEATFKRLDDILLHGRC
eukprot:Opistho-2@73953